MEGAKKGRVRRVRHSSSYSCTRCAYRSEQSGAIRSTACDGNMAPPGLSHASRAASTESNIASRRR